MKGDQMKTWLTRAMICLLIIVFQAHLEANTSNALSPKHKIGTQIDGPVLQAVNLFIEHVTFLVEMHSESSDPQDPLRRAINGLQSPDAKRQLADDLRTLLGDKDLEKKAGALLVEIQYEFTGPKLASLRLAINKRLIPEARMPWPLCIPFKCK
jgi:hypothetical protein